MLAFFRDLFKSQDELKEARNKILQLESTVQSLRLDLEEQTKQVADLRNELSLQSKKQDSTVKGMLAHQSEALARDLSAPLAQLLTQAHLASTRQLQAKDVIAVSMRLVECLQTFGIKTEGEIGQTVAFDSSKHEGMSLAEDPPAEGSSVKISMPGISFQEKILRKIAVCRVEENGEGS